MYDALIQKLNTVWVEIGVSKIHGVGVKAIRPIPKNTIVFSRGNYNPENYHIKKLLDGGVDPNIIKTIKKYYAHDDKIIQIDKEKINKTNFISYLNHNVEPNLDYINENYITRRNIKKGEELTINYTHKNYCPSCIDFKDNTKKKTRKKDKKKTRKKDKKKNKTQKTLK